MAYCTLLIIENLVLPHKTIVNLTADDMVGEIDNSKVAAAIKRADAEIDKYIAGYYSVPLAAPVSALVEGWSAELAAYYLHRNRQRSTEIIDNYNKVMANLSKIAAGVLSIPGVPGLADGASTPASTTDGQGHVFNMDTLDEDGNVTERGNMGLL